MNENKFTPRAEEALRLSQEAAQEMDIVYVKDMFPKFLPEYQKTAEALQRIYDVDAILAAEAT